MTSSPTARLDADLAHRIIDAALRAAQASEHHFAIAVVDAAGYLREFVRQDAAPLNAVQVAQDKAYTAATSGMSTQEWADALSSDPVMAVGAPGGIARFVGMAGGVPIRFGDVLVGAIGVSGGHYTDDAAVADAALSEVRVLP